MKNCIRRQRIRKNAFSFLELIMASFMFTLGIMGIFPVLESLKTSRHDLIMRFNALQIAGKELYLYRLPPDNSRDREKPAVFRGVEYRVKTQVENMQDYDTVTVTVEYISGRISGMVSLATITGKRTVS